MEELPNCPECKGEYTYEDGDLYICPECAHEWSKIAMSDFTIKDANGNTLQDGDSVTVIKDLKVKGSSNTIKVGTKVKNIKLIDKPDQNIDSRIDGFGSKAITAAFVKKV